MRLLILFQGYVKQNHELYYYSLLKTFQLCIRKLFYISINISYDHIGSIKSTHTKTDKKFIKLIDVVIKF